MQTLLPLMDIGHAAAEIEYSGRRDLIEMLAALLRKPDLTLFLDVDPVVAYGRRVADLEVPLVPYECSLDQACSEIAFILHQTKIRNIMEDWRSRFNWTSIDADVCQADDRIWLSPREFAVVLFDGATTAGEADAVVCESPSGKCESGFSIQVISRLQQAGPCVRLEEM
jgi:hypothetical protein